MPERLTISQVQAVLSFLKNRILQGIVEPLDSELTSYRTALLVLRRTNPDIAQIVDAGISVVRESPALRETMHQKYHVVLEKQFEQFVQQFQDIEDLERISQDLKQTFLN